MAVDDDVNRPAHPTDLARLLDEGLPSVEHLRDAHVEAMVRAFQPEAAAVPGRRPGWTRRARRVHRAHRRVLLAAAVIACIATTSALAATGSLPDPVQRVAERAASRVGIDLPSAAKGARVAKLAPAERSVDAATRRGSTPMARPSPGAPDAKRPLAPKPPKQAKANPVPRAAPTKASSRPHQPKPAKAVGAAANRQDTAKRPVAKPPKERPPKVAAGRAAQ